MALSLFAACGKSDNGGSTANNDNAEVTGTVSTDGSTSMEKVIMSLGEAFQADNKGITVGYNPTGSGSGITAVSEGRCDIGLASRALKDDEKASGLKETVLALDGIAIIVNPENKVSGPEHRADSQDLHRRDHQLEGRRRRRRRDRPHRPRGRLRHP